MKFIWNNGTELEKKDPLTINTKLEMPDFSLKEFNVFSCDRTTSTGKKITLAETPLNLIRITFNSFYLLILILSSKIILKKQLFYQLIFVGSYACLEVSFILQRDLSVYINEFYVPSSFVVSLSFVSFFIDYKSAAARAPLGATSVLTVTNLVAGKSIKNLILYF